MSTTLPAVVVDGVSKSFRLPHERVHTLKERVLHPLRRPGHDQLRALRDVSFSVQPGEFFGIVGRNGSGKSTLLKCMAGIYGVDAGRIYVNGRLSTFIELGVGFNPDLPARDNVMINATMLGLSPREARRRFDEVIDFAELHEFIELKLKNYSSGMMVRLAFAVMIQVDATILLIDEVLAVGDAAFQQKCFDEFARIRRDGKTVLLVTHDMAAVRRFCDRAMLLEHGRVIEIGDSERVGTRYLELNFSRQARDELAAEEPAAEEEPEPEPEPETTSEEALPARLGDQSAEILEAWFEDEAGQRVDVLAAGRPCTFVGRVAIRTTVDDPIFGLNMHNSQSDMVLAASNFWSDPQVGRFEAGEEVIFRVSFQNLLTPDRYDVTPAVARAGSTVDWLDRRERLLSIQVIGVKRTDAVVDLPYQVAIERLRIPA